jgi:TRAP-type C4-dicarboxylate transport system permease small subunit
MDTLPAIAPSPLIATLAEGVVYLALLTFTIYVVVYGYHWFQYGSSRRQSLTALTLFIVGGVVLLIGLVVSLQYF